MTITYHEDALTDLQEAVRHYSKISWKLAAEFEADFQGFLEKVRHNPRSCHFAPNQIHRRANLKRFPYRILYRFIEKTDTVRLLIICHNKRHPSFGMERL
jgi:plasmid stabilization system protein ParE